MQPWKLLESHGFAVPDGSNSIFPPHFLFLSVSWDTRLLPTIGSGFVAMCKSPNVVMIINITNCNKNC